jgi:hypothetical protein
MLNQCSPNAHPMLTLFGSCCRSSRLRHLSERGSGGPVLVMGGSDWGQLEGGLSAPHAHLGPRGPLIHAGLPCESARLVMQGWTFAGDAARRKGKSGEGRDPFTGLPATGEQLLAAKVAEAQSW